MQIGIRMRITESRTRLHQEAYLITMNLFRPRFPPLSPSRYARDTRETQKGRSRFTNEPRVKAHDKWGKPPRRGDDEKTRLDVPKARLRRSPTLLSRRRKGRRREDGESVRKTRTTYRPTVSVQTAALPRPTDKWQFNADGRSIFERPFDCRR